MFELDESNAPLFAGHIFNCGLSQPRSSTLHVILRDFEPTPTLHVNEPIAENTA
jgi:hypothetical protein